MKLLLIAPLNKENNRMVKALKQNHYSLDWAGSVVNGLEALEINRYDVVILEWDLGGEDCLSVLTGLRQQGNTSPILVLSQRGDVQSRVQALDNGADDYMPKPVENEELMARIRALYRRNPEVYNTSEFIIGALSFYPEQCLIKQGGNQVALTLKESMILELLTKNINQVVTKEQLLQRVWGFNHDVEINNIEVYISHLRKKLKAFQADGCIQTVRGVGYCCLDIKN